MANFLLLILLFFSLVARANNYCLYDKTIPRPNYDNLLVKKVASKLSRIKASGFFHYRIEHNYKVRGQSDVERFLVQLCGEYRDRPSMIDAKLKWLGSMSAPLPKKQGPIDPDQELWPQVTAFSYGPWLELSNALWLAKRNAILPMGRHLTVEG